MVKRTNRYWVNSGSRTNVLKPSQNDKDFILNYFQPLIEEFKLNCIKKNPNREFNYLVDIYSKWTSNYFYICEKYKSERANRLEDEFEVKLLRLKYLDKNLYELSYFRHTGQWQTILPVGLTCKECKEMILANPLFHPNG